jgi:hypothetical protein
MPSADEEREAQVDPTLGGAILGGRGNSARGVQTLRNQWCDLPQRVEYRAAKKVLSLVFSFYFLPSFLSLSSVAKRMTGRRWLTMREDVRLCKGSLLFS